MDYNTQLQLNALLKEFLEDGDTFDAEKAKQFRDMLPSVRIPSYTVAATVTLPSFGAKGHTNTGHDASIEDDEKKLSYTNAKQGIWVGRWDLNREDEGEDTTIYIKDRFADTRPEEPEYYTLDFKGGEPVSIRKSESIIWNFIFFGFTKFKMNIYKTPEKSA